MKFAYTRTATAEGRVRFAPLLEARLHGPCGVQRRPMLVDSGSEERLIPRPLAEMLGVLVTDEEIELLGVGGVISGRVAQVEIHFKDQRFMTRFVVSDTPLLVLGHQDVFNRFWVAFDANDQAFHIAPSQPR